MSLAASLINMAVPIGSAIGFATTAIWFNGEDIDHRESLHGLIYVQNVILTFLFVFLMLFLREKPSQPPSAVALEPVPKRDICDAISKLRGNSNYVVILMIFSVIYGIYVSLGNLVSLLFTPFGLDSTQIATMSILMLATGIFTTIIFGAWLDKTHKFKTSMIVLSALSGVMILILCFYAIPNAENYAMLLTISFISGLILLPLIPTCVTLS